MNPLSWHPYSAGGSPPWAGRRICLPGHDPAPCSGASPAATSVWRIAGKRVEGKQVMGRERGPAGRKGVVGRPGRTPSPLPPAQPTLPPPRPGMVPKSTATAPLRRGNGTHPVLPQAPPPPDTRTCGWCPMPGGTLPCLWVVPYEGRNSPKGGQEPPSTPPPPRMGGVAPQISGLRPRRPCAAWSTICFGIDRKLHIWTTLVPPTRLDNPM